MQKKYIIGYSDDAIRPIRIFLPQMIGYVKCFDDNKTMSFLADNTSSGLGESRKKILKEYIKVWEKIRDFIGKKFNSEPVYGDKYIK